MLNETIANTGLIKAALDVAAKQIAVKDVLYALSGARWHWRNSHHKTSLREQRKVLGPVAIPNHQKRIGRESQIHVLRIKIAFNIKKRTL